jgi:mannitol/fructose-specific phosphotransferase system IIA component (Ntr-type)
MSLSDIFVQPSIKLNLESSTKEAAFIELIELIMAVHPECDRNEMFAAINNRENKMNTSICSGAAVPHGYCQSINGVAGAIGISKAGIDYDSFDHKPVHVIFMLVMSNVSQENHLSVLNQIFKLANSEAFTLIRGARDTREVHTILSRFR